MACSIGDAICLKMNFNIDKNVGIVSPLCQTK